MAEAARSGGLSIRWRLTAWITAAFIITIVVIFIALRLVLGQVLYDDVRSDLPKQFGDLQGQLVLRSVTDPTEVQAIVDRFPFPAAVRSTDGTVIAANAEADSAQMSLSETDIVGIVVENESLDHDQTLHGENFRVRSGRANVNADTIFIAQVGRSTQAIDDVVHTLNLILLGGGAAATVVVLAVGYWLARRTLGPVEQITHTAAEIEASDLKRRISASGKPTEIQRLADTFDGMLARLEAAFAQQRNFVMDVSHELRTPLTSLRGNLDVMLMDKNLDPEARVQLERMSAEVGRLIRLTSNLLYLAHAEAGREIARRPVELDELCLEVVYQARTLRDDVSVRFSHEEQVTVSGDRDLLKQLVLNLVDNAIKYSPDGGEVTVSLYEHSGRAEIIVADQGPGIPEDQLGKIFERFYRVSSDGSRTVGGAGIGLAISRWIAQVHGGDIRAERGSPAGSRFVVSLPLAPEEAKVPVS
jgi:two-component system, OmpR family, sensor kinase